MVGGGDADVLRPRGEKPVKLAPGVLAFAVAEVVPPDGAGDLGPEVPVLDGFHGGEPFFGFAATQAEPGISFGVLDDSGRSLFVHVENLLWLVVSSGEGRVGCQRYRGTQEDKHLFRCKCLWSNAYRLWR